jgi:5-methylcytosine-specific restriction endonuclease McrA
MCRPCRRTNPQHLALLAANRAARERVKYQRRSEAIKRDCAQCGITFNPTSSRVRTCSLSCGQKLRWVEGRTPWGTGIAAGERSPATIDRWQRKNRRRRALKRGSASERYSLVEIAVRDRHRCKLCGKRVAMKIKVPNLMAPTIDHVIPISHGGDDTKANVQLAHFGCNNRKSNRGGGEQLALVG